LEMAAAQQAQDSAGRDLGGVCSCGDRGKFANFHGFLVKIKISPGLRFCTTLLF
jgi:hypothetical protein